MGAGTSLLRTSGQYERKEVDRIINQIMREMMSKAGIVDLYSLSDPLKCKEYVVMTSKAMEKVFSKITLYPGRGSEGSYFFQKLSGIKDSNPIAAEQEGFCMDLAFFYVRIFQIFAAVSLTILNTEIEDPFTKYAYARNGTRKRGAVVHGVQAPGFRGGGSVGFVNIWDIKELYKVFKTDAGIPDDSVYNIFIYLNLPTRVVKNYAEYRGDLFFSGYLEMGEEPDEGVLSITQESLYDMEYQRGGDGEEGAAAAAPVAALPPRPSGPPPAIPRGRLPARVVPPMAPPVALMAAPAPSAPPSPAPIAPVVLSRRTFKGDKDVQAKITYEFKKYDEKYTMKATMQISKKPQENKFGVTLSDFYLDDQSLSEGSESIRIERTRDGKYVEESTTGSRGYQLPTAIVNRLLKVFQKTRATTFSPIEFLHRIRALSEEPTRDNRPIALKNTSILIPAAYSQLSEPSITFVYSKPMKYKERKQNVRVKAALEITEVKSTTRASYAYKVEINFDDVEVVPSDMMRYLDFSTNLRKMFYANSKDVSPVSDEGLSIPKYLESRMEDLFSKRGLKQRVIEEDIKYNKDYMPIPHDSTIMPPSLKVLDYWKALKKSPAVKAHAVARALQLLDANAILNTRAGAATTNVCNLNFPLIKDRSLPDPSASITSEYSIAILNHLFYTKLAENKRPQISNREEYLKFVKILEAKFARLPPKNPEGALPDRTADGLSNIKDYMMSFCKGSGSGSKALEFTNANDIKRVRYYAQKLLERQQVHTRNALSILFKLFDRKHLYDGEFSFSDALERGGIGALNHVSEEARDMLIAYFTDCEEIYKNGLLEINRIMKESSAQGKPRMRPSYLQSSYNNERDGDDNDDNYNDDNALWRRKRRRRVTRRNGRRGTYFPF